MTRDNLLKRICPFGECDCCGDGESYNCDDCNRVLEEWLDEYDKQIRAKAINDYYNKLSKKINTDTNLKDTIREIHDNVANEMYCKGIDEFLAKVKEKYPTTKNALYYLTLIAEELKAGVNNE